MAIFVIAFRGVELAEVGRMFRLADPGWIIAAVVSVFATVACSVMRWRALLGPAAPQGHFSALFAAVIASQVANLALPLKLGDAVRIAAISRRLSIAPSEVLGSVAIERLFDAAVVALSAAVLAGLVTLPPFATAGMAALASGLAAALAAIAVLVAAHARARHLLASALSVLRARVAGWVLRQTDILLRGVLRVTAPRVAATAFLWSAAVMAGSTLTAWLVLRAFDLDAPAISAAVVVIAVQIGGAVVPVPGAVGVSQVVTVQTLALWGLPEAPALAYALMLYLVSRVPKLAVLPFALSALRAD